MPKIALRSFHSYISLLISVQLLLWTISGIYFSFNKIENIRGEQYIVATTSPIAKAALKLEMLDFKSTKKIIEEKTTLNPSSVEIIIDSKRGSEYRGRDLPLYKTISYPRDGEKIDVFQNPFSGEIKTIPHIQKDKEINVYQNPYSGEIVAIRSNQWRIWDFMWGLHIIDWVDRDNIGNIFLKFFSFLALFTSISGLMLFFKRA